MNYVYPCLLYLHVYLCIYTSMTLYIIIKGSQCSG